MVPCGVAGSDEEAAWIVLDLDVSNLPSTASLLSASSVRIDGLDGAAPTVHIGGHAFRGAFEERIGTGLAFWDRVDSAACSSSLGSSASGAPPTQSTAALGAAGSFGSVVAFDASTESCAAAMRALPPMKRELASCLGVEYAGRTAKRLRCHLVALPPPRPPSPSTAMDAEMAAE